MIIGIDVGGSGIKGALVDLDAGVFASERIRIPTPEVSSPENCAKVIARIIKRLAPARPDDLRIGITVPAPVVRGVVPMIANLDQSWRDLPADTFFEEKLGHHITLINDADAAGLAEVYYGAAKGVPGLIMVMTLGTGIGSAVINNGILLPNTEFGHIEVNGLDGESQTSAIVRERENLTYPEWAERLDIYFHAVERLMWPDLFVIGGGISKNHERFLPLLHLRTPIIPAALRNRAGIVGAAWAAAQ